MLKIKTVLTFNRHRFMLFNTFPDFRRATEGAYSLLVPLTFWIAWNVLFVGVAAIFTAFGEV